MDKGIINILKSYGCGYMADDYKEMIEEIETFVKEREKAIDVIHCCKSDSELLSCNHEALISIGDGFGNTFCPMCKTYNPTT